MKDTPNRDVSRAWRYHDLSKHSEWSIRAQPHYLDWANQPIPVKIYPTLQAIPLPRDAEPTGVSAFQAIAGNVPVQETKAPGLRDLTRILYFSAGITKKRTYPAGRFNSLLPPATGDFS